VNELRILAGTGLRKTGAPKGAGNPEARDSRQHKADDIDGFA